MDNIQFCVSWLGVFAAGWRHGCVSKQGVFDFAKFERFVQRASNDIGADCLRIFPYETKWLTSPDEMFSPHLWNAERGAWDLTAYDPRWFYALREMIRIAAKYNVRIKLSIFDNCQLHIVRDRVAKLAPWMNNTEGIPFYMVNIPASLRWVDKVYAEFGNAIDYELGNEITKYKWQTPMEAAQWLGAIWMRLVDLGVPAENISFGARPSWVNGIVDKATDLTHLAHNKVIGRNPKYVIAEEPGFKWKKSTIVVHKLDKESMVWTAKNWLGLQSLRVDASNDGVIAGTSETDMDVLPSGEIWRNHNRGDWYAIAAYLISRVKDQRAQGYFPKLTIECLPHAPSTPEAWVPEFMGAVEAFRDATGNWPENYGKFPAVIPDPLPEPEPEPEPEPLPPAKSKITWQGWLGLGVIAVATVLFLIAIL